LTGKSKRKDLDRLGRQQARMGKDFDRPNINRQERTLTG